MRAGTFTIGDFSLFVYLLQSMGDLTTFAGMLSARYKQLNVSVERMYRLMEGAPLEALVEDSPVDLDGPLPEVSLSRALSAGDRLDDTGGQRPDLPLPRQPQRHRGREPAPASAASLTVITGRVGSGKTTLLRVLLGLLPRRAGRDPLERAAGGRRGGVLHPAAQRLHRRRCRACSATRCATTSCWGWTEDDDEIRAGHCAWQ